MGETLRRCVNAWSHRASVLEWRGRPYNQLLVSLLLAMGLAPHDFEAPGEPGFGDYSDNPGAYDIPDRRAPLPGLLAVNP